MPTLALVLVYMVVLLCLLALAIYHLVPVGI